MASLVKLSFCVLSGSSTCLLQELFKLEEFKRSKN